jgi:hypothetical protein
MVLTTLSLLVLLQCVHEIWTKMPSLDNGFVTCNSYLKRLTCLSAWRFATLAFPPPIPRVHAFPRYAARGPREAAGFQRRSLAAPLIATSRRMRL